MIEKLLIANRGEIAARVMRSAHSMGISCVAVYSDADAGSPHVTRADEALRLPGERASDTYLRIDAVVEAAQATGAQAIHPGYGFLSENADFARACESAGLVFVGPPSSVIEAMGSKLAAKAMMSEAGVPVLPTVTVPDGEGGAGTTDGLVEQASQLGWPVLVKASAGGGGRGMRVVERPEDLATALESARRESSNAFGDATVFLEPYALRTRHVEVQIFGDTHGNVVHLFERECSIQRRHQKIVEEAPSPSVDAHLRSALGDAAVRAARAIGYVNAGTVEFLLLPDRSFAFLEVNTRLQVEHTVTESVTGLDLVRLQLLVAEGLALPEEVLEARLRGHAIEVRVYAEDPTSSWQPSAGTLHRFFVPNDSEGPMASGRECAPCIRLDTGVEDGSVVTTFYDPLLAKVVSSAPSRLEAARALSRALVSSEIHGLTTNRDLLVRILRHDEFLAGDFDTGFLEGHDPSQLGAPLATAEEEQIHAVCAAMAAQAQRRLDAPVLRHMPSGWRNVGGSSQRTAFEGRQGTVVVSYRFDRNDRLSHLEVDDSVREDIALVSCDAQHVVLSVEAPKPSSGQAPRRSYKVHRVDRTFFVDGPNGSSALVETERFPLPGSQLEPGALVAPLPGTVVNVKVEVGDQVHAGAVLAAIEAMKMEHEVRAATDGTVVAVNVESGQQVEAGEVLVVVEPTQ